MRTGFQLPDYAWLVQTMDFAPFLDLAFTNDAGEVWLFNNDLRVWESRDLFHELYVQRISGTLNKNIKTVRFLVHPELVGERESLETAIKKSSTFCGCLAEIASVPNGPDRLSRFYFGVADRNMLPNWLKRRWASDDTWIFYAQGGNLDSGIAILRHRHFPFFIGKGGHAVPIERRVAMVWMLQHYPAISEHLKSVFPPCFKKDEHFERLRINSLDPFDFHLERVLPAPLEQITTEPRSVSPGDPIDVAIVAALSEEMAALKEALGGNLPQPIPLHADYEYVRLRTRTGDKRILLTTLLDQGSIPAAIRTWDLILHWQPRRVILVGVAGGDPRDGLQELGDVVVGSWVIGYEHGKILDSDFVEDRTKYDADELLLKAATNVKKKSWPRSIPLERPAGDPEAPCKVHDDVAIGSGSKLVVSPDFFEYLQRKVYAKIKAVEMEADGVGGACEKSGEIKVKSLVIKGIMDKCDPSSREEDPDTRRRWRLYAARAAAEFAIDVVRDI